MVGTVVNTVLSGNAGVSAIVGNKIFPLRATQGTTKPYIIYRVSGLKPSPTKDGRSRLDTWEVTLAIVSDKYQDVVNGSVAVRNALDFAVEGNINGVNVALISVQKIEDMYNDDELTYNRIHVYEIKTRS